MTTPKQVPMFPTGDDLPLFSNTPQQAHESTFKPETDHRQETMFQCSICRDTGYYVLSFSTGTADLGSYCICETGRQLRAEEHP